MLGTGLLLFAIVLFLTRRYYYALLLFFGFVTNGYQFIPPRLLMAGAPTDKLTDLALVFLVVALGARARVLGMALRRESVFRWVGLFVAFVAIDGVYSVLSHGYEVGGVLRVFRTNLFLLGFGVFFVVPTPALTRLFHTIAVITVVQSVVFLIQIPLGTALLNSTLAGSEVATTMVEKYAFTRFYNTPAYLTPVLAYYLFQFRCRSRVTHLLVLSVLLLTVLAPLHRIYIFSIILIVSLYILFRQSRNQRVMYIAGLLVIGYGVSMINVVSDRIEEGFGDFGKTFTNKRMLATNDFGENTFAYRMAHLYERVRYVVDTPGGYVFGIGLLSEDARQAQRLSFQTGAVDEQTGQVAQINTGDITWSLLILQLGFVGMALFVVVLVGLIRLFYRHRSAPFGAVGLVMTATAFLTSFAGTEVYQIPFRTLAILLAVMVTKIASRPPVRIGAPQPPAAPRQSVPIVAEPASF